MNMCIIPARGGSRRIPRKNVRPFLGVPAIVRSIDTIIGAGVTDSVVVSTDDEEVASLARRAGASVPGMRPPSLAGDHTTTSEVVRHVLTDWSPGLGPESTVIVLYPTAVLLRPQDLVDGMTRFIASGGDFLMPVLRYRHPVERRLLLTGGDRVRPVHPEHANTRTQDLPVAFHDAGQFYIGRRRAWLTSTPMTSLQTVALELSGDRVIDIDTEDDWRAAELMAQSFRD
jgi:pseudaminic acid cytidylyltransferase